MSTLRENVARESPQLPLWTTSERLDRQFEAHRKEFPAVYRQLLAMAREAKAAGWARIGIGLLWERLRYEHGPHKADVYGFGCNNSLRSRYARALVKENPDLGGLFEFRELRGMG